ncbi:MAG: HAMP domain-containing histidine kinase, partial [Anaerolineae bacterium]|nr:HAMP domain-containing histidine kinase [Anaerolineae bacterium]
LAWESTYSGTRVYECEYRRKDGSVVPVEVSSRLTRYDQREVLQNFVRDITERRQAEEQRLELMLEKERIQILADFISQASHEFRTPLTVIRTSTYILEKTSDPEQQRQKLRNIEGQVRDIITLLDSLTLMAQLDGGGQDFQFAEVDLNGILREVCQEMQSVFPQANPDFVFELSAAPLLLHGDDEYLKHALHQIVENAVRHSPAGGAITICSDQRGGSAVAEISDRGDGIRHEDLPRIFERFFRADKAGTTRGFGLGLPIAQKIIELHQGRVEVESEAAAGSTFRIVLPLLSLTTDALSP